MKISVAAVPYFWSKEDYFSNKEKVDLVVRNMDNSIKDREDILESEWLGKGWSMEELQEVSKLSRELCYVIVTTIMENERNI